MAVVKDHKLEENVIYSGEINQKGERHGSGQTVFYNEKGEIYKTIKGYYYNHHSGLATFKERNELG